MGIWTEWRHENMDCVKTCEYGLSEDIWEYGLSEDMEIWTEWSAGVWGCFTHGKVAVGSHWHSNHICPFYELNSNSPNCSQAENSHGYKSVTQI
jgi:hypothetical protein